MLRQHQGLQVVLGLHILLRQPQILGSHRRVGWGWSVSRHSPRKGMEVNVKLD